MKAASADEFVDFDQLQGASSFAKKLTYGFSDSFSKVTGSIGKGRLSVVSPGDDANQDPTGISAAALDSEWQARRRMTLRRNKPKHALYVRLNPFSDPCPDVVT
jgi:vacuolar protein sorting-associated protein 13A/C